MRKNLYIALSIFSIAFWLWRLPFIIWLPIPEFSPDTFDYFSIVKALREKTAFSYTIDIPLGFPVIAYLAGLISDKIFFIIWIQFLLKFLAGITLIYIFYKYYKWGALPIAVILSIYVTDSWSLRYDTCLIPDSLYNSFLIITVAFLINSIKSRTKTSLILLSVSMFWVAFIRSNGLYIYFLVPVLMVLLLPSEQRGLKYTCLLGPIIILHLLALGLKNYSGVLYPKYNRVEMVLNQEKSFLKSDNGGSYFANKWGIVKEYARLPEFPSFYFNLLPGRYNQLYKLDIIHNPDYEMFNWSVPIPDDLRKLVYREYYTEPNFLKKNLDMMDVSYAYSHLYFLMLHTMYKIQNMFFRNIAWYFLILLVLMGGCWGFLKSSFTNTEALIVILICFIHLFSFLVIIFATERCVPRYTHVSEFLLYLAPVFALLQIFPVNRPVK